MSWASSPDRIADSALEADRYKFSGLTTAIMGIAMSLDRTTFNLYGLPSWHAGYDGVKFNQFPYLSRLILATAAWRRTYGRYPDSIHDLVPNLLERSFTESAKTRCLVYRLEPAKKGAGEGRPVFCVLEPPKFKGESYVMIEVGVPLSPIVEEKTRREMMNDE
jgi:hypothetical protein